MALDDPNITKVIYREYNKKKLIKTDREKEARLACVMLEPGMKPVVNIIDLSPGEYHITCRKRDLPQRKVWFETTPLESYLPKKKSGRYD